MNVIGIRLLLLRYLQVFLKFMKITVHHNELHTAVTVMPFGYLNYSVSLFTCSYSLVDYTYRTVYFKSLVLLSVLGQ